MRTFLFFFMLMFLSNVELNAQEKKSNDSLQVNPNPLSVEVIQSKKGSPSFTLKVKYTPFHIVEQAPVFPGCRGRAKALKKCFIKKMRSHVGSKFDAGLFESLELSPGPKRMLMMFNIDENGVVSDINIKAPHPKLAEEGKRVLKLLPKFMPAKSRGKPVGVSYTLPFLYQ